MSAPGLMVFAAALYAKLLAVPLVVSYHTHVPEYIPKCVGWLACARACVCLFDVVPACKLPCAHSTENEQANRHT